ncbi:hypothetical protein KIN20_027985 [Parelaphostrongylus tenuis]|uniref:Uncharacterized protein n=1 Tax=Parelaphostrongylus tenuis TaxID=148309 RepID=A0AAD5WED8_PARTN|nr:hypothetical protein KIN20_027985 [Parelaphostrongylus tenuis]
MEKADNREVLSQTTKKRKLHDATFSGEIKRVNQDLENSTLTPRRLGGSAFPGRRAVDVLSDLLSRLQEGDRQIMLLCIMRRSEKDLWTAVLKRLLSETGKEATSYLDDGLLLLLTEGLKQGAMSSECIPVR